MLDMGFEPQIRKILMKILVESLGFMVIDFGGMSTLTLPKAIV